MRAARVYRNGELAGMLIQNSPRSYEFKYYDRWFADPSKPAISLTLPKTQQEYRSEHLFPFFFNMIAEGVNRQLQSRQLQIDEHDHFGFLLETAGANTIGAVTIVPVEGELP